MLLLEPRCVRFPFGKNRYSFIFNPNPIFICMKIEIANKSHYQYAAVICDTIAESAKIRGIPVLQNVPLSTL